MAKKIKECKGFIISWGKKKETLAEYYYRMNKHLLNGISIFEINEKTKKLRKIN